MLVLCVQECKLCGNIVGVPTTGEDELNCGGGARSSTRKLPSTPL